MTEGDDIFEGMGFDPRELLNNLRKSASVKAGAVIFGQAQIAYYDTIKEHMSEEDAYNMLAHTTECILRSVAETVGPLAEVLLRASVVWEQMGNKTDKEVPGGGS